MIRCDAIVQSANTSSRKLLFLAVLLAAQLSFGQGPITGTPPFGSFGGGPFDTVNLGNLNVHFAIPVIHKAGRGMPFTYDLSYDSSIWSPVSSSGTSTWTPVPNWGWRGVTEITTGYVSIQTVDGGKDGEGCSVLIYSFVYHDPLGVSHNFWPTIDTHLGGQQCIGTQPPLPDTVTASDGSGYSLTVTSLTGSGTLTSCSGKVIVPPFNTGSGAGTATDANGNQIKVNTSGQFFDTLSSTTPTLTVAGTAPSSTTFTYTGPSGSTHYTMNYGSYSVKTTFGCTGISEYSGTAYLVSSIVLPDTSEYTFTYETLGGYYTGRLASVTLPTGGTISYAYTGAHDGIVCPDGSTLGLTINRRFCYRPVAIPRQMPGERKRKVHLGGEGVAAGAIEEGRDCPIHIRRCLEIAGVEISKLLRQGSGSRCQATCSCQVAARTRYTHV